MSLNFKKFYRSFSFLFLSTFLFLSCGGDKKEKGDPEETISEESSVTSFTSESGKVSFKYSGFWKFAEPGATIEIKAVSDNDHMVEVYIDEYSGNLRDECAYLVDYEHTFDNFKRRQGVTEVQVDGLPAMHTSVSYFLPERGYEVIESDWIIYNGKESIVFRSISPADKYNESQIFRAIGALSINDRAEEVSLEPSPSEMSVPAPEFFPEKALAYFESDFDDTPVLTSEIIDALPVVWEEFMNTIIKEGINPEDPGEEGEEKMNQLLTRYSIKNWDELLRAVTVSTTSLVVLPILVEVEKNTEGDEIAAGMGTEMAKSMITQGNIAKEDITLVFENWDMVVELNTVIDKHKQ